MTINDPDKNIVPIKKVSFSEKFKSKNAPKISGVETVLAALPIYKIGEADDWCRLHPSEEQYWSDELCFCNVPIHGTKKNQMHVIEDDLASKYLPSKKILRHRLALASKPHDIFFLCIVPSQNLDNVWNSNALEAINRAQTHWIEAVSRKAEGKEGYEIKYAQDQDAFPPVKWPSYTLDELLSTTFAAANIDHDRHPSLLRLIGAKPDLK
jgi:hypothetical protein